LTRALTVFFDFAHDPSIRHSARAQFFFEDARDFSLFLRCGRRPTPHGSGEVERPAARVDDSSGLPGPSAQTASPFL
jgi:hypothetical protein